MNDDEIMALADAAWAALPGIQQQSHDPGDWLDGWVAGYKAGQS